MMSSVAGYDTVSFSIDGIKDIRALGKQLSIEPYAGIENGEVEMKGNTSLGYIKVAGNTLFYSGSIPKALYGDNIDLAGLEGVSEWCERISDTIKVDIKEGVLKRVDITFNAILDFPVCKYIDLMGESKKLMYRGDHLRNGDKTGLYYRNWKKSPSKKMIVYDKGLEIGVRPVINMIRFESQNRSYLKDTYELPNKPLVKDLMKKDFLQTGKKNLLNCYNSIKKRKGQIVMNEENSLTALKNIGIMQRVESFGGITGYFSYLDRRQKEGTLDRKIKNKIRDQVSEIYSENSIELSDLANELDRKVFEILE